MCTHIVKQKEAVNHTENESFLLVRVWTCTTHAHHCGWIDGTQTADLLKQHRSLQTSLDIMEPFAVSFLFTQTRPIIWHWQNTHWQQTDWLSMFGHNHFNGQYAQTHTVCTHSYQNACTHHSLPHTSSSLHLVHLRALGRIQSWCTLAGLSWHMTYFTPYASSTPHPHPHTYTCLPPPWLTWTMRKPARPNSPFSEA